MRPSPKAWPAGTRRAGSSRKQSRRRNKSRFATRASRRTSTASCCTRTAGSSSCATRAGRSGARRGAGSPWRTNWDTIFWPSIGRPWHPAACRRIFRSPSTPQTNRSRKRRICSPPICSCRRFRSGSRRVRIRTASTRSPPWRRPSERRSRRRRFAPSNWISSQPPRRFFAGMR